MIEDLIDRHVSQPDPPELCPECHTPIATCECEKSDADGVEVMPTGLRITAIPMLSEDLKPGDLFSTAGPEYWDVCDLLNQALGERVYIRMSVPTPTEERGVPIFKIVIERKGGT